MARQAIRSKILIPVGCFLKRTPIFCPDRPSSASIRLTFVGARVKIYNPTYDTFEIFRVDWQPGSEKAVCAESTTHFVIWYFGRTNNP